ncbi:disease resistance-like protein DSC1 [Pistacia vera]|uniref:disease resistance-like protein DSC1 n=1 Tax=Pistacia vera TaxID=55513 RepID=UPI001262F5E3|nr:disease resistance-like protein DSC1 [Pistacia vera]
MRQELFSTILKHPISFTKGRLSHKRVFIVFDDVTTIEQVESLIDDIEQLGSGSRIIITTTNKQVLRNCGVDDINIYEMKGLFGNDALQLFSWYAFRQNRPNIDYDDLSNRVVKYTRGVPLAIKVLGCYFLGKSKQVWESALKKFERILHEDIYKVLKISYDGLNDVEQCIFLDIACFLEGETKDFVLNSSDADDGEVEIALIDLADKCLITISEDNKIMVHGLLQEMGWEIDRQESTGDPGKRSRLWYHEDIYKVLEENKISNAIEGICLDMSKGREIIYLQPKALAKMDRLRFFKLHNAHDEENNINKVHVSDELRYGWTKLRYLCWHGFPLESLQINLWKNLVALDMPHSNIEQLWSSAQLHKLKHIDLSFSKYLRIQDLSLAPNLENLILESCTSLCEITSSIDGLNYKLLIINLRHCKSLGSLPTDIRLESLEKVIFSGCSNLKKFPQISWNMKELYLDETAIEKLPSSIENLSRLVKLNLKDCLMLERVPSNICKLRSLEHLNLSGCSKLEGLLDNLRNLTALRVLKAERVATREVPTSIPCLHRLEELDLTNCCIKELANNLGQLSSLKSLLLGRNFFESIPTSIVELSKLSYLDLSYCERLQVLPEFPRNLRHIDAYNCTALGVSSSLSIFFEKFFSESSRINLSNCFSLNQDAISEFFNDKPLLEIYGIARNYNSGCVCFPGSEIPELFVFKRIESFITLGKQEIRDIWPSLLVCVVVEFRNYHNEGQGLVVVFECLLTREDGTIDVFHGTLRGWNHGNGPDYVGSDHVFLGYDSDFNFSGSYNINYPKYCEMTIRFYVENFTERSGCCNVKKCGVLCRNGLRPQLHTGFSTI